MIKFTSIKDDNTVKATVEFGTTVPSYQSDFVFKWMTNDPHYAYLLAQHFQKRLDDAVRSSHRKAYLLGYKDGRGHNPLRSHFSPCIDPIHTAW